FILSLFLIPLLIGTIVVLLWLLFGWLAHMGHENAGDLVRGIERGDAGSGQLAFELAGLLRSSDPKYDALRNDSELASRLATFLERDLKEPLTRADDKRVMRRMYLCRMRNYGPSRLTPWAWWAASKQPSACGKCCMIRIPTPAITRPLDSLATATLSASGSCARC